MPIHDWTRVDAGIFHAFHHRWISAISRLIWDELIDNEFAFADKPLSVMAYIGGTCPEVFLEPLAVGLSLPEMPVFLDLDVYVPLPLQPTYDVAWQALPSFWREVVQSPEPP